MQGSITLPSTSGASVSARHPRSVRPRAVPCVDGPSAHQSRPWSSVSASAASPCSCSFTRMSQHRRRTIAKASVPSFMSLPSVEGYIEVAGVKGARLVLEENEPVVQYLVEWKDGSESTWERGSDLSSDLVRDFEDKWWGAARKADFDTLNEMLKGAKDLLAHAVDENRRSALHFAAALGKVDCAKLLLEAGADPNLQDTQGYTPLHMAAGYMHTSTMTALLVGGSDPQIKDNTGKDVVSLLDGLRNNMPLNLATVMQRLRLEEVANSLTDLLYEEIPARCILEERTVSDGSKEYLVAWADGREDCWVPERDVSDTLKSEWQEGIEGATAVAILDMVQVNTERRFKIKWSDNYPESWEPEEHVPEALISLFKSQNPALFQERVEAAEAEMRKHLSGRGMNTVQAAAPTPLKPSAPAPESVPLVIDANTLAAAAAQQQQLHEDKVDHAAQSHAGAGSEQQQAADAQAQQKDERALAGSAQK